VNARDALIRRIKALALSPDQPPLVTLEEFFDGNEDYGSIGCNLSAHPGPQFIYRTLRDIRSRPNVQDVLVEIAEVEEQDSTMWPFSERVYILTTAIREQVAEWAVGLQPDEIEDGFAFGRTPSAPTLEAGMNVYGLWWD
jgi:hypothetical protein